MLQMTVIGKKSELPKMAKRTMTALTNRKGASFRRNCATGGASHRRRSSEDRPLASSARGDAAKGMGTYDGAGWPNADAPAFMPADGIGGIAVALDCSTGCGGAGAGAARGAGAERDSSAATSADASGKRLA